MKDEYLKRILLGPPLPPIHDQAAKLRERVGDVPDPEMYETYEGPKISFRKSTNEAHEVLSIAVSIGLRAGDLFEEIVAHADRCDKVCSLHGIDREAG